MQRSLILCLTLAVLVCAVYGQTDGVVGISDTAANVNVASQSFNQGGGFGHGGGMSGSAANAGASSQTFNQGGFGIWPGGPASHANDASQGGSHGFGGGMSGSAANAAAASHAFNQGAFGGGSDQGGGHGSFHPRPPHFG